MSGESEAVLPGERAASPRVSVIVLNWNGGDDLLRAVESLEQQTLPDVEIIVVDNASSDGSFERLGRAHPGVTLLPLPTNTGYCAGNNAGLARARGEWVLFLNCDAWLDPHYLERALAGVERCQRVGFIAGKVLRADGRTIDTTGQLLSAGRRVIDRGYGELDRGQYDEPGEVPGVCGAAALYSRALIADIAADGELFDEWFFAFSEDADVSWRARRRGWRGLYRPTAVAFHRRGGTGRATSALGRRFQVLGRDDRIAFHIVKNRFLMILKNESLAGLVLRAPLYLAHDLPRLLLLAFARPRVLLRVACAWDAYRAAWARRG